MIEIAVGLVLALALLAVLPFLLIGALVGAVFLVVAAVVLIALFDWHFALSVLAVFAVGFLAVKLPAAVLRRQLTRRADLRAMLRGLPPYSGVRNLPLRAAVRTGVALLCLLAFATILVAGIYALDRSGALHLGHEFEVESEDGTAETLTT